MKVYISPYQLELQKHNRYLQGSLLLFEFKSGLKGYSDFLPWPQFGEPSLKDQLNSVKEGQESQRWICSKNIAFCDALAREKKQNLFFNLKVPESHFLIEDISSFSEWKHIEKTGYNTIKIKIRRFTYQKELPQIKKVYEAYPHFKWRLDFNGSLNFKEWDALKKALYFLWSNIEFIEDPFKNPKGFFGPETHLFAEDWIENRHYGFRIVKPSRDSFDFLMKQLPLRHWKGIVFTHSHETLLGQAATAYLAGRFYKIYPSFWQTGAFKSLSLKKSRWTFQEDISPFFKPPSGFGLGYGHLLEKEPWKRWI